MPTDEENMQYLYLILTAGGPPTVSHSCIFALCFKAPPPGKLLIAAMDEPSIALHPCSGFHEALAWKW
jgi:hypothetical protein